MIHNLRSFTELTSISREREMKFLHHGQQAQTALLSRKKRKKSERGQDAEPSGVCLLEAGDGNCRGAVKRAGRET
jgi:hypothetical protein